MTLLDVRTPATRDELGDWPDLTQPARRRELTPAGLRALARLGEAWELSIPQVTALLGGVSASSWHAWRTRPPAELGVDQLTRISLLLGIYTALHVLHAGELADRWVRLPNSNRLFGGRPPVEVMAEGGIPVLLAVRELLDGRRGGL